MLSEERINELANTLRVKDGDIHGVTAFARAIEAECEKVPEGYALISIAQLKTWGHYEALDAMCQYPLAAAPKPAQASPLDLMECLQDRPVEPSKAVQGKCVVQAEKQEPVAWVGCGECDCEFPCYHGKTTCLRLPTEKDEPVAYLAGMYRSVIEGKAENIPLGATISFINMGWKNQIELYIHPQPDLTAEVERLRRSVEVLENDNRKMVAHARSLVERSAELEEAARQARDTLQYKLHVVEAIAKLDAVLGNAELTERRAEADQNNPGA